MVCQLVFGAMCVVDLYATSLTTVSILLAIVLVYLNEMIILDHTNHFEAKNSRTPRKC